MVWVAVVVTIVSGAMCTSLLRMATTYGIPYELRPIVTVFALMLVIAPFVAWVQAWRNL